MEIFQIDTLLINSLVSFVLYCIFLFAVIYNLNRHKLISTSWWFCLIFCVFALWNSDYFHLKSDFDAPGGLENFRDPLYKYLYYISFKSYTVFRFYIWGLALLFYYKTTKRLDLNINISIFVFGSFFIMMFSYARASLGMAILFYVVSLLVVNKKNDNDKLIKVCLLLILTFMVHRSMLILILMLPIIKFFSLNEKNLIILLIVSPIVSLLLLVVFKYFSGLEETDDGTFSSFSNSANMYVSAFGEKGAKSWKTILMGYIHRISYFVIFFYIIKTFLSKRNRQILYQPIAKFAFFSILIFILSLLISLVSGNNLGLNVLAYRIKYMCAIPACLCITYLYQHKLITQKKMYNSVVLGQVYALATFVGTILSYL